MKRPAPVPARSVVSSSPGRPEKLPAPGLGRLLRGKSGSRSRGRSSSAPRSSPMFISRSRSAGPTTGAAAAEGDPSSPKVSCIGQVRIRSKKKAGIGAGAGAASKLVGSKKTISMEYKQQTVLPTMRCRCLTRLCKIWPESRTTGGSRSRWSLSRWFKRKSRSYRQRESGVAAGNGFPPPATAPRCSISDFDVEELEESEEQEEETRVFMPSATSTPPKNALLLMRCRSAPHNRSSALATSRFAITPVEPEPEPELKLVEEQARIKCRDDAEVSCNQNSGDVKEEADTLPVVLTRCKSEPARTAAAKLAVSEDDVVSFCSSGSGRRLVEERRPAATTAPPASPSLKPI